MIIIHAISTTVHLLLLVHSLSAEEDCDGSCLNAAKCLQTKTGSKCQCHPYFSGQNCSDVNLRVPLFDVDIDSITFEWPSPILLANYSVVTYRVGAEDSEVKIESLPNDTIKEIIVDGLRSERTRYVLCMLRSEDIDMLTDTKLVSLVVELKEANAVQCGHVLTAYDGYGPYAKIALGVIASMAATLVLLGICRAASNCRNRERREKLMADVMGMVGHLEKLEFLNFNAAKKTSESEKAGGIDEATEAKVQNGENGISIEAGSEVPDPDEGPPSVPPASQDDPPAASIDSI